MSAIVPPLSMRGKDLLIIEDDKLVAQTIRLAWPVPADRLRFIHTYQQSIHIIESAEIDNFSGVILDIGLPDGNGLSITRTIRSRTDVPIILISGQGTATSRADALDLGADDYVMKPFSVRELQARMARLISVRLAKNERQRRTAFTIGRVHCDLQQLTISAGEGCEQIGITDTEARLLEYLHRNLNRNCGRSELYKSVMFRQETFKDRTLEVYVSRIRKKIGTLDSASAKLLQTVRGFGYRMSER